MIKISKSDFKKLFPSEEQPKSKNKYNNKHIVVNGIKYDSKDEYLRHCELLLLEKAGEISSLEYHIPKNNLILQENPIIKYEPDFCYCENGKLIVEDVKGYKTKDFKIKQKIIYHKINIGEFNFTFRLTKKESNSFKITEEYSPK